MLLAVVCLWRTVTGSLVTLLEMQRASSAAEGAKEDVEFLREQGGYDTSLLCLDTRPFFPLWRRSEVQTSLYMLQYGVLLIIDMMLCEILHVLSSHSTAVECCSQSVSKEISASEYRRWGMREFWFISYSCNAERLQCTVCFQRFHTEHGNTSTVCSFLPLCACVMQVAPLAADGPHASWLTNKR